MAMASSGSPCVIDSSRISSLLSFPGVIQCLRHAFADADAVAAPPRHHHCNLPPDSASTLLLMPAWPKSPNPSRPFLGVKLVTVFPHNAAAGIPSVSATYLLSCARTGVPCACIDGSELTLWRTAGVSALAADFLARKDVETLLMVGAGAMAPYLIRAHCSVRPSIRRVLIWNRTRDKAEAMARVLQEDIGLDQNFEAGPDLEKLVRDSDVVSCATMSEKALVQGTWMRPGMHLDLVGSFSPSMRECDEDAIMNGSVFVDSEVALEEAGELVGLNPEHVQGTLAQLASGKRAGRKSDDEITVFKSVGSAISDLAAAQFVYEKHQSFTPCE